MPTLDSLKTDIRRHLNDRAGLIFTDEAEVVNALESALREIMLIRDPVSHKEVFPGEFTAFMSSETDELSIVDNAITLPTDSLRIIGGRVGSADITAVKGLDYEWRKNESISKPDVGFPWLVVRGNRIEVWPKGEWDQTIKAVVRYVTNPPSYDKAHPAIVRAMTLTAARDMAYDREQYALGNLLRERAQDALSSAIGVSFDTPKE